MIKNNLFWIDRVYLSNRNTTYLLHFLNKFNYEKNRIGLDAAKAKALALKLNILLADYQFFYINACGFHWNIKGEKFFELRLKLEELYNDALI